MHLIKRGSLFLFLLLPSALFADAIMITRAMTASTIAEVYIEKDAVRVELEIGMGDIPAFKNILPDAIYDKLGNDPSPIAQRLELFFREDFVIEAGGEPLRGGVLQMEPRKRLKRDNITGEPLPNQGEGQDILFVELVYPMEGKPKTLSIQPPTNQDRGLVSVTVGLMTYHLGLPIMDFRYLGLKETIQLDWEDPWYSRFENKNLWRQYNEPISAFLYAEPFETRVEVIVRPKDIQQWHDLGIRGLEKLPVELQPGLKEQIAAFLLTQMELTVDGEKVVPQLQRINFLKRTLKSSIVIDPPEELDAISATLGVIYSVPTESLPQEAALTWNLFSPKMQVVRAAATDEAGPLPYKLMPDDNVLVWKNFLKNPTIPMIKAVPPPITSKLFRIPVGTVLCLIILIPLMRTLHREKGKRSAFAGGAALLGCAVFIYPFLSFTVPLSVKPKLSDTAATEVVSGLLKNVYTSFDFRDENTIYDALDQSLVGDLLTDVYLETKKSLVLQSQGGAQVKVKAVSLEQADFKPLGKDDGFSVRCTWNVMGSVGHWGHIHQRTNRYDAELSIQPIDGQWKITRLEVLQEQRVN
jgi:hypothetical protein